MNFEDSNSLSVFPAVAPAGCSAFACSSLLLVLNAPFILFHVLWPRALVLGDPSDVDCEFCAARHDGPEAVAAAASADEAGTIPPPALLDLPRFQPLLLWSTLLDLLSRSLFD